jgi:hypothetical protein
VVLEPNKLPFSSCSLLMKSDGQDILLTKIKSSSSFRPTDAAPLARADGTVTVLPPI